MPGARPMGLTITKFERIGQRAWRARVTLDGITADVEHTDGSWKQIVRDAPRVQSFHRREVPPAVAAALQEKMPSWMRTSATFWNDAQKAAALEPFVSSEHDEATSGDSVITLEKNDDDPPQQIQMLKQISPPNDELLNAVGGVLIG